MDIAEIYGRLREATQDTPIPPEIAILQGATKDASNSLEDSETTDYRWFLGFAGIVFVIGIMIPTWVGKGVVENAQIRVQQAAQVSKQ